MTFKRWVIGLLNAVSAGVCDSTILALGVGGIHMVGVEIPNLTMPQLGAIASWSAVRSLVFYVKKTPIPTGDDEDSTTTTPIP